MENRDLVSYFNYFPAFLIVIVILSIKGISREIRREIHKERYGDYGEISSENEELAEKRDIVLENGDFIIKHKKIPYETIGHLLLLLSVFLVLSDLGWVYWTVAGDDWNLRRGPDVRLDRFV